MTNIEKILDNISAGIIFKNILCGKWWNFIVKT